MVFHENIIYFYFFRFNTFYFHFPLNVILVYLFLKQKIIIYFQEHIFHHLWFILLILGHRFFSGKSPHNKKISALELLSVLINIMTINDVLHLTNQEF